MSAAVSAILEGMPEPRDLRMREHDGRCVITAGQVVLFEYAAGDIVMRNIVLAALRQLGFRGRVVAAVLGLTENYVATLHNAAKRDGTAALIGQDRRGGPGKVTAAQWARAQAEGDINPNTRGNLIRGALNPIAGAKQIIELDGEHATLKAHVAVPSIYINLDDDPTLNQPPPGETASAKPSQPSLDAPRTEAQKPEQPQQPVQAIVPFDRFRIVRVQVKSGKRIVGDFKRSATGKITQQQSAVKSSSQNQNGVSKLSRYHERQLSILFQIYGLNPYWELQLHGQPGRIFDFV